jgi:hypothetical protein
VEPALQRVAPVDLEILRFDADAVRGITVTDEELQKAFEEKKSTLQAPEKRSVRYVALVLTPGEKELPDKDRVAALQKLATATGDLTQALGEGGSLADTAQARGLEVRTSPLFGAGGATTGALADLDGEVVPAAAAVAFRLPAAPGNFEIIELAQDGYAIIEVAEVQAARPLTLEEASADLRAGIMEQKRAVAVQEAAAATLGKVREAMAKGDSFAAAVKAARADTETMKGISPFAEDLTPTQRRVAMAVMDQAVGTLGEFVPGPEGGFAAYVAARNEPGAEALAERRPKIEEGMLQGKEMLLFAQWLVTAREAAGLQVLRPMM